VTHVSAAEGEEAGDKRDDGDGRYDKERAQRVTFISGRICLGTAAFPCNP
jgi:hypothetical protein